MGKPKLKNLYHWHESIGVRQLEISALSVYHTSFINKNMSHWRFCFNMFLMTTLEQAVDLQEVLATIEK